MSKEQGQAKRKIGMLMKESHSIFRLDEKQKQWLDQHQQKIKEDGSQKQQAKKDKDFSHLKKKAEKFQGNILQIPAERQKLMEKDHEYQMKKEREK